MAWDLTIPASVDKIKECPEQLQANWAAIATWTNVQHYGLGHALSGSHKPGQCSVMMVETSAAIAALTDVPCAFAYATDIGDFGYNDGSAWVIVGGPIETGTKMVFYADTAPVGWTLNATLDDKLVYITKGSAASGETGGSACSSGSWTIDGFSASIGSHTLTTSEIPSHNHVYTQGIGANVPSNVHWYCNYAYNTSVTTSTGGGGGHTHPMASHDGSWHPAAYCFIICTKD
jgi:hypothetical protein